jgi:hypothetical protein
MRKLPLLLLLASLSAYSQDKPAASGKPPAEIPSLEKKIAGMKHLPGFLPLDWDAKAGKLYLEIPHLDASGHSPDLLYTNSLPYGTGSNDLGLDRGQTARGIVAHFERIGPKVLLVEPNQAFRSLSTDPAESLAVTQSFPSSILFGFTVAAETNDSVLIDATDFFLRDVHNVTETLARLKQGTYKVDATRSAIALDSTKAFPQNTEVEAELTFTTDAAPMGKFVRDVTPDPHAMTIRERSSFVELPPLDGKFVPRRFNPRAGYFPFEYRDYTAPLGDDLTQRYIERHRLIKRDPACTKSCEALTPIQYYVDRGAPEPIRSALLEGARWWDQAFQAAGWAPNTFRVDILPADADPMDVRYNIIQWVHRYTRGWSYGATVTDPRTGEILKGNVTLGSLRGRQDYMIAEALTSPYDSSWNVLIERGESITGPSEHPSVTPINPMLQMVLARIRQLAAHETGHTLGLAHNFAASIFTPNDHEHTLSVMEYPHPWITLDKDGKVDLSHAYPVGIGLWDKTTINYGYREFDKSSKPVEDPAALTKILTDSDKTGMVFLTDEDARPFSSASPIDHLWDNSSDPTAELLRVLDIRAAALKNFGENTIKPGTPMSKLADVLVPLYLFHRYQTEATIKLIGGLDYRYNLRGDGQPGPVIVGLKQQDAALDAVLKTLAPETLTLPESILKLIPPVPPGYPRNGESFPSETGLTFDPVATAEAAADLTLQVLFDPARASRLLQYHMRDTADGSKGPSLRVIMEKVSKTTAERPESGHSISSEVERAVEFRGLEWMLGLAVNPAASTQARAIARYHVEDLLHQWTTTPPPTDSAEAIHRTAMIDRINDFNHDPEKFVPAKPIETPPGMPIGDDEDEY